MEIFKLYGRILVDSKEAEDSISKTETKAQAMANKLGGGIKTVAKWGTAIGAGAIAAGAGLFAMANKAAGVTDRIDKLSQKIGISREGFQEWEYILSQSGTDIEKLQVGLKTMVQRMDETANGVGQGAEIFEQLGIAVQDSSGAMRSQEEIFEDSIRAFQNMAEGPEKARLAFELFGKTGQELMPLLNDSNQSLDDMKDAARNLGLVLSDEAVDAGVAWTDRMDDMKRMSGAIAAQIGTELMPIFHGLMEWLVDNMPQILQVVRTAFNGISKVVKALVDYFNEYLMPVFVVLFDWIVENMPAIQEKVTLVFDVIKTVISTAVKVITAIWDKFGDNIMTYTKFIFNTIWEIISGGVETIIGIIKWFVAIFTGDFEEMVESGKEIFSGLWKAITAIVRAAWTPLSAAFSFLYRHISGWFNNLAAQGLEWGRNLISGFIDGIKSMIGAVKDAVGNVMDSVKDFMGFSSPTKEGPGRFITDWGENMILGFMDGINNAVPSLRGLLPEIISAAATTHSQSFNQTVNLYSPTGLSPSEVARQTRRANRELALEWGR